MESHKFGNFFSSIINQSLKDGEFPDSWKTSTIIPIPKVQNPKTPEQLRPINILPVYEGILERVVKEQLTKHINENNILVDEQSGFREQHSCETALNLMMIKWKEYIEHNKIVFVVFLDFKRAFETIDRRILLDKLQLYGVQDVELQWFKSYLADRKQIVKIESTSSSTKTNDLGVPQGSVLGPLLFALYINDIKSCVEYCHVKMFADDTLISIAADTREEAISKLNHDLERVSQWIKFHKLALNISKTKYMLISLKQNIHQNNEIKIDNCEIERVAVYKYLGVMIDQNINLQAHQEYIESKMMRKLGLLKRLGDKLPKESKIVFYKSLVAPHIDYCSSILFLLNKTQLARLQKVQNKFMRCILKKDRRSSKAPMLEELGWLSVNQRISFNTLKLMYKIEREEVPAYLKGYLTSNRNYHQYSTRNTHYRLPNYKKNFTQNQLLYKGLNLYNMMQRENTTKLGSINLSKFKKVCNDFIKNNVDI